jgi:hypothetical protein
MGIGHRELLRIQFMAASKRVKITLPSIFESYATGLDSLMQRTYFSSRNRQEQICEIPAACRLEFPECSWHGCEMDPAKHEPFLPRTLALACSVVILLSACADRTRTTIPPSQGSVSPRPAATKERKAPPPERERSVARQTVAPKPPPSKAEQIIGLVRGGRLVNQGDGALVFSKSGLTHSSRSGLYEDAILLARLRRSLKETAGVPESVSAGATVRDAKAFLEIDDSLPAATAASAIDAGLRTPGIIAVQARTGQ